MNKNNVRVLALLQKVLRMLDFVPDQEDNEPRNQISQDCLLILTYL